MNSEYQRSISSNIYPNYNNDNSQNILSSIFSSPKKLNDTYIFNNGMKNYYTEEIKAYNNNIINSANQDYKLYTGYNDNKYQTNNRVNQNISYYGPYQVKTYNTTLKKNLNKYNITSIPNGINNVNLLNQNKEYNYYSQVSHTQTLSISNNNTSNSQILYDKFPQYNTLSRNRNHIINKINISYNDDQYNDINNQIQEGQNIKKEINNYQTSNNNYFVDDILNNSMPILGKNDKFYQLRNEYYLNDINVNKPYIQINNFKELDNILLNETMKETQNNNIQIQNKIFNQKKNIINNAFSSKKFENKNINNNTIESNNNINNINNNNIKFSIELTKKNINNHNNINDKQTINKKTIFNEIKNNIINNINNNNNSNNDNNDNNKSKSNYTNNIYIIKNKDESNKLRKFKSCKTGGKGGVNGGKKNINHNNKNNIKKNVNPKKIKKYNKKNSNNSIKKEDDKKPLNIIQKDINLDNFKSLVNQNIIKNKKNYINESTNSIINISILDESENIQTNNNDNSSDNSFELFEVTKIDISDINNEIKMKKDETILNNVNDKISQDNKSNEKITKTGKIINNNAIIQ